MNYLFIIFVIAMSFVSNQAHAFDHQYQVWNDVLSTVVKPIDAHATAVDYRQLKNNRDMQNKLKNYTNDIQKITQQEYNAFTNTQRLAFLINAYNALTLQLVTRHYPATKNIRKIKRHYFSRFNFRNNTWDVKFFKLFGKAQNLNYIEHELLRKKFNEPRIHFAINCASIGCPALQPIAFTDTDLEQQLAMAEGMFLTDRSRNKATHQSKRIILKISRIFKWFGQDFIPKHRSLHEYLAPFLTNNPELQQQIHDGKKMRVIFGDYDWTLNEFTG